MADGNNEHWGETTGKWENPQDTSAERKTQSAQTMICQATQITGIVLNYLYFYFVQFV